MNIDSESQYEDEESQYESDSAFSSSPFHEGESLWIVALKSPLLTIVILEAALGASGRWFEFGEFGLPTFITPRMIISTICMAISAIRFSPTDRRTRWAYTLTALFTLNLTLCLAIGLHNQASGSYALEDVKQLSYFLMLPYFVTSINCRERVYLTACLLRISSLILAAAYILYLIAIQLGLMSFSDVYSNTSDSLVFRGETGVLFYKGFIYIVIGVMFFSSAWSFKNYIVIIFLSIALWLSATRALFVAEGVGLLFRLAINAFRSFTSLIVITVGGLAITCAVPTIIEAIGDRQKSDSVRFEQLDQVREEITGLSALVGHGFGIGVPIRPVHMEITYLEIFHKQGIIGLLIWVVLLSLSLYWYVKTIGSTEESLASSFFLSIIAVYVASLFNPFLNNSIGLSIIFMALSALCVFANDNDTEHQPLSA